MPTGLEVQVQIEEGASRACRGDRHCAAGDAVLKISFTHFYFFDRADATKNSIRVKVKENVGTPTY
jgi:hypothetical protein